MSDLAPGFRQQAGVTGPGDLHALALDAQGGEAKRRSRVTTHWVEEIRSRLSKR